MIGLSSFRLYQTVYDSLKKKKSIFRTLAQWIINYYPGYLGYICLLFLLPSIISGPYLDIWEHFSTNCGRNWFKLLTFTSNYEYLPDLVKFIIHLGNLNSIILSIVFFLDPVYQRFLVQFSKLSVIADSLRSSVCIYKES